MDASTPTDRTADRTADDNAEFTIALIGGGSAAEELLRRLDGSEHRVVLFEPALVGGECPFLACMPSKSMLHDRTTGRDWAAAVARRDEIAEHRDDSGHADEARRLGATIVRSAAQISGRGTVTADGTTYAVDHIVIATGATPTIPDIPGLDGSHDRVWTSDDALSTTDRPSSVAIIGGGVIGSELAFMFAGFGIDVVTLDSAPTPGGDHHPRVSELIRATLVDAGVMVRTDVDVDRVELGDEHATVHLSDGSSHTADRVVVAIGRVPNVADVGLGVYGIDPDDAAVDDTGRLIGADGVWMIGDVAGREQYTHVANHQADVVADQLTGAGVRRFGDAVVPACIFLDPPVIVVGDSWSDLADDDDVVWAEIELSTARSVTDEHGEGFLAVAARRSTGRVVAANGIGARFDEIIHALVVAIDGEVPVDTLCRCIQPFPTVGEVLGQAFDDLAGKLRAGLPAR